VMKAEIARSPEDYQRLGLRPDHIEPWEDGIRTSGEPGTYEWWYFDVHLDDGAKLVVTFFTKPFVGVARPMTPMISIELDMPSGRTLAKMLQAPPEDFTAATDHCDVRIRGNSFVGDLHTYRI